MKQPYLLMTETLNATAMELGPIIQTRLQHVLKGNPWPVILKIIDENKGFKAQAYEPYDLRPQLRLIRTNLNKLGDPFWDGTRRAQNCAFALKTYRDKWAHMAPLTLDNCWDAADLASRLFLAIDEAAAAVILGAKRDEIEALIRGEIPAGVPTQIKQSESRIGELIDQPLQEVEAVTASQTDFIEPDPEVFVKHSSATRHDEGERTLLEAAPALENVRDMYTAWLPVQAGHPSAVMDLPAKAAKEQVRDLAQDIVEFEGPIQLDRLVSLIARSFGVGRLHVTRRNQVITQVKATEGLTVDKDKFVWPEFIDREEWREFRPNDSDANRQFETISPSEIANAAEFIITNQNPMIERQLEVALLKTFGRKALTTDAKKHLKLAFQELKRRNVEVPPKL